ncbi:MAG: flotillin family protein [Deltaproteobacteria bacterium]|nr:flotillin family protein [Deltaproteobacteria bacterium]
MKTELIMLLTGIGAVGLLVIITTIKRLLYICQPNEVLILSGVSRNIEVGGRPKKIGYRIVKGGRALRKPLFERIDRMDLTNMIIDLRITDAYSKGGIPLTVSGVANIKVPGEEPLINNTIERFLGFDRGQIMKIAKDTLEGNLRGVLATLTPEQVNEDKISFAKSLLDEAEQDLGRLGLVLDSLRIQNVSDEAGYLNSLGRKQSAEVQKNSVIAEASAQADAAERAATNEMETALVRIQNDIAITKAENERRIAAALSQRAALVAEEQSRVVTLIAKANAEVGVQGARQEQVRRQLEADVVLPAKARQAAEEAAAKAGASTIIENGIATARALSSVATAWAKAGPNAKEIFLMQKLDVLLRSVVSTVQAVQVNKLTMLPAGSVDAAGELPTKVMAAAEQLKATLGIDIAEVLRGRGTLPSAAAAPTAAPPAK